ncbi:MAG TPA: hypothetical protein ENN45_02265 [Bacteroidetes bacterium]|nr:hypothetical protein [Bacteroidota bacterium]
MTGYQDFVKIFGSGIFIKSNEIKKNYSLQKALSSLYIIPTFFRGIHYIPTSRERKGHFIENKQDFFTHLFNFHYGKKKWYWGLSTAARYYGIEWSSTRILEIVALEKSKTINVSDKILSLQKKKSYRSATLSRYLSSLDVNLIYIHKGNQESLLSIKIDETIGPVCTKEQILKDIEKFTSKIRNRSLKKIYKRIATHLEKS